MLRAVFVLWGLLIIGSVDIAEAHAQSAAPETVGRPIDKLRMSETIRGEGGGIYRIDVYDPEDNYNGWLLEIRCAGCEPDRVYREIVHEIPARIFKLTHKFVVTEWSTAVATILRVYDLEDPIRPVLEFGGRGGVTEYSLSDDTKSPFIVFTYRDEDRLKTYHAATWNWNGTEFVKTTRCIEACEHDRATLFDEIEKRRLELLVLRARLFAGSSVYRLDIYDSPDDQSLDQVVDIRCTHWCKHDNVFREVVDNSPIAAFVLHDGARHFVTIWGVGAVAASTRIYFVSDEEVSLVLEAAGRGGPRFEIAPDGSPLVIVTDFQAPISGRSLATEEVWRWNGKEYESLGKKCVDNCDNDNRRP